MTSINHFCYKAQQPVFAPPSANVVYSPCFPPRSDLFHGMVFPCSFKRSAKAEIMSETTSYAYESASSYGWDNIMMPPDYSENKSSNNRGDSDQETLPLFPLQPTGRSEGMATVMTSSGSSSAEDAITAPCSLSVKGSGIDEGSGSSSSKPFFDFFSGQINFDSN